MRIENRTLCPQRLGGLLRAGPRDEGLDDAFEVVVGQARRAVVDVLLDLLACWRCRSPGRGRDTGSRRAVVAVVAAHGLVTCSRDGHAALARVVGEQLAQHAAAAVQPGHHRADRRVHDLGDLLVRETLDVGEVDRVAEVVGQLLQGVLDVAVGQVLERLHLGGLEAGRRVRLGGGDLPVLDLVGDLLRLALLLAVGVDVRVGEDAVQPRLEVGARRELVERAERLGVGLLDEVLGVVRAAGHAQAGGVELVEEGQGVGLEPGLTLLRGLGFEVDGFGLDLGVLEVGRWCRSSPPSLLADGDGRRHAVVRGWTLGRDARSAQACMAPPLVQNGLRRCAIPAAAARPARDRCCGRC